MDWDDYCPTELLWKFNDKPDPLPKSGEKYNAELKDTNTKCQKEFILSIFDVTESDEGTYSCHWLCKHENPTGAAIDLIVVDELQTGRNLIPVLPLSHCHNKLTIGFLNLAPKPESFPGWK